MSEISEMCEGQTLSDANKSIESHLKRIRLNWLQWIFSPCSKATDATPFKRGPLSRKKYRPRFLAAGMPTSPIDFTSIIGDQCLFKAGPRARATASLLNNKSAMLVSDTEKITAATFTGHAHGFLIDVASPHFFEGLAANHSLDRLPIFLESR